MQFHTGYKNRPTANREIGSDILLVERVGYVSAKKQIESLQLAGLKLSMARAEQFHYDDYIDIDNAQFDVTNRKDFDFAEAFAINMNLKHRLKEQHDEFWQKAKSYKDAQDAQTKKDQETSKVSSDAKSTSSSSNG